MPARSEHAAPNPDLPTPQRVQGEPEDDPEWPALSAAEERMFLENTSDESSQRLHIPEPMVFDLVRPLGANRGEFESNVLLQWTRGDGGIDWAPEVEYAFLDGHAVEFELPMHDMRVETLKVAYQVTLPSPIPGRWVHGLQLIGKRGVNGNDSHSIQPLYIGGIQLAPHLSILGIAGARVERSQDRTSVTALINPSIFYSLTRQIAVGLETNWEFQSRGRVEVLVMPQIHMELGRNMSLQAGAGVTRSPRGTAATAGMRWIVTF